MRTIPELSLALAITSWAKDESDLLDQEVRILTTQLATCNPKDISTMTILGFRLSECKGRLQSLSNLILFIGEATNAKPRSRDSGEST